MIDKTFQTQITSFTSGLTYGQEVRLCRIVKDAVDENDFYKKFNRDEELKNAAKDLPIAKEGTPQRTIFYEALKKLCED